MKLIHKTLLAFFVLMFFLAGMIIYAAKDRPIIADPTWDIEWERDRQLIICDGQEYDLGIPEWSGAPELKKEYLERYAEGFCKHLEN